mmetsp:Transcript_20799/g.34160  ORF Transcript_20799/g.34160 Transcript_20799/m.34160 type:complete len:169 (-) Transcript_20799:9-515(-)
MAKKRKGKKKTKGPRVEKYFDLGDYSMKISTKHSRAQLWYNRGLRWCFGFNHEEAVRCFENALKFDSRCPMIYWGIGYASGSNYNNPTNLDSKAAYEASHKALQLSTERKITNIEQQIIKGLVPRCPPPPFFPVVYVGMAERRHHKKESPTSTYVCFPLIMQPQCSQR